LKALLFLFILLIQPVQKLNSAELLLKNGESYIINDILEKGELVTVRWKGREYNIPKSVIQRIDYSKKGSEISYKYSDFQLTDGSTIRGILVEDKPDKVTLKTELGFAVVDKSRILNLEDVSKPNVQPDISDRYLSGIVGDNKLRIGASGLLLATLGPWAHTMPLLGGGGLYLERTILTNPSWYWGVLSEYSISPSALGNLSLWNQSVYLGKSFGVSAPYFLLGGGLTTVQWRSDEKSISGSDPEILSELGWGWETSNGSLIRLGLRSQCTIATELSLCRAGLRFSLGVPF